jgi:hypothetical protein
MLETEKELPPDEIEELQKRQGKLLDKFEKKADREEQKKQKLDLTKVFVGISKATPRPKRKKMAKAK